ncbi:MAG: hypothetical protein HPY66_3382 [Firmicutes bacterium]|nr:hypothetical protein [Bacillota bacterium]
MYYYPPAAAQMPGSNHPTGNTQIPQMPILGYNNFPQLIQYIYKAIIGEATAVDFYSRLLKDAPDEISRDFIEEALNDEKKHLNAFLKLYKHFCSQYPQYAIDPMQYPDYKTGVLMAMKDELEAAEFYKNVILSSVDPLVRDTFFYAMGDELRHATMFSFLYHN